MGSDGGIEERQFYLADVEAIVSPVCVVPDISCVNKQRYFEVLPRKKWAVCFEKWLEAPFDEEEAEINTEEDKNNPPKPVEKPPKKQKKRRKRKKSS